MTDRPVTIKDIAKAAGVSYSTVSRALAGSTRISAATRERVRQLCREMGYTPNYVARSMVVRETKLIGLVVANAGSPFMSEVSYHAEIRAREQGYSLLQCNSCYDPALEEQMFSLLLGRQADGILISPTSTKSYSAIKQYLSRIPTVFIGESMRNAPETFVSTDNHQGGVLGMEYLYRLGHRDTVFLGRRKGSIVQGRRADGYAAACVQYGLTPRFFDNPYHVNSIAAGRELGLGLFTAAHIPTAIFCATDIIALGVMQAADECGLRVPQDVSVLGFDNITYAGLPKINLTTMEQPKQLLGTMAVDLLIQKIHNPNAGYVHQVLKPALMERASCCPPAR